MIDREQLKALAARDPRIQQASDAMEQKFIQMNIAPEDLEQVIQALEFVLEHPEKYPEVVAMAVQRGMIQQGDVPQEFNPQFLLVLLTALYDVQERMSAQQQPGQAFARGGLAQAARRLAAQGRGGDTILAHINPREAEALRRMGGSGTVNPNTGVMEFKGGGFLGEVLQVAVPIAAMYFGGPLLAGALGGGTMGAMGAGAIMGGLGSAVGGGDPIKGALMGGLSGGLGSWAGDAVGGMFGDAMGTAVSQGTKDTLGSALVGGMGNIVQGGGFGEGAARGALGSMIGSKIGGMGDAGTQWGGALQEGGKTFGNMLTAGYSPQQALLGGVVGGGLRGFGVGQPKPSEIAAGNAPAGYRVTGDQIADVGTMTDMGYSGSDAAAQATMNAPGDVVPGIGAGAQAPAAAPAGGPSLGGLGQLALAGAILGGGGQQPPPEVQRGIAALRPEQQAYFNRPQIAWDWAKLGQDAASRGMDVGQYLATNWNAVTSGTYNQPLSAPVAGQIQAAGQPQQRAFAAGGLNAIARLAQGGGSGRDDTIDARLSDGEYVMDAETVALLGDGSTKSGAHRLDKFREEVRKQKGKALSRGKISPDAKSPLAYLKEAA